jgi:membrane protein required for colicin V production
VTWPALNWVDWLLIVVLALFALGSARRGFSREVIGLAAAVFALVFGMWFYGEVGAFLMRFVSSERTANLLGFLLIVGAVLLAGRLLGLAVRKFFDTVGLSFFDRLLGAAFGFLKGLIVCIALLTGFVAFGPVIDTAAGSDSGASRSAVLHSRIAPWVLEASHFAVAMAPMELKSSFLKQYASVKLLLEQGPKSGNQ